MSVNKIYLGNCTNSFDEETGECIQPDLNYFDVTDFAQCEEGAVVIEEEEFRKKVTIDEVSAGIIASIADHTILYLYDEDRDLYMIYDDHDDIHYFFG